MSPTLLHTYLSTPLITQLKMMFLANTCTLLKKLSPATSHIKLKKFYTTTPHIKLILLEKLSLAPLSSS